MTTAALEVTIGSVCADVPRLAVVGRWLKGGNVTDEAGDDPPRGEMTATAVGRLLGKDRKRVHEISRDDLPYVTTRGGPERGGRRYYRREDVEAYLRRADRLAAAEGAIDELRARVERLEQRERDG